MRVFDVCAVIVYSFNICDVCGKVMLYAWISMLTELFVRYMSLGPKSVAKQLSSQ